MNKIMSPISGRTDNSWVLIRPRITEKGNITATEARAYIFEIHPRSTKLQVKEAIKEVYKVTPLSINIAKIPSKRVRARGKMGTKSGGKKAYVYLKEGDSIEFV